MHLLPVLILAFPGTRIDSTLVLCLCGQATDLVSPSYFALPRGTSGLRLAVKLFQLVPSGLRVARLKSYIKRDSSSLVKGLAIWVAFASPKPLIFLTACPTISHGQFALIDGVSYVMGRRVGIYDTHCDRLEDLPNTPSHPIPRLCWGHHLD